MRTNRPFRVVFATLLAGLLTVGAAAPAVMAAPAEPVIEPSTGSDTMGATPATPPSDQTDTTPATANPTPQPTVETPQPQEEPQPVNESTTPDVTIHDTLDADTASVTHLSVDSISTGTAPFDADDTAGNDSGEDNLTVRSFDTVTYTLKTVATADNPMDYYKSGRIGYRIHLPVGADKAVVDTANMGWVDHTAGWEPKTTTNADGTQTTVVYRHLTATSSSPTVIPGTYWLPVRVNVLGMTQGEQLTPTFDAWTAPNDTHHREQHATGSPVNVSSRPQFNVRVNAEAGDNWQVLQPSGGANTWDFTTDETDGLYPSDSLNRELGQRKGIMHMASWGMEMLADNPAKGTKGTEYPKPGTPITVGIDVKAVMKTLNGGKAITDAAFQPYLYVVNGADGFQNAVRWNKLRSIWTPRFDINSYPNTDRQQPGYKDNRRRIYDAGHMQVAQTRQEDHTTFTITIDDWRIDPDAFPTMSRASSGCSPVLMMDATANPCTQYLRRAITGGQILFMVPTEKDGQSVTSLYKDSVTEEPTIMSTMLHATGISGTTTDRQSRTTDDKLSYGQLVEPTGRFSMYTIYGCSTMPWASTDYNGMDCNGWRASDAKHGTDKSYPGEKIRIQLANTFQHFNQAAIAPVFSVNLFKFDDRILEFDGDLHLTSTTNRSNPNPWGEWKATEIALMAHNEAPTFRYAVKRDGTGWTSDQEQNTARIDDLDYYDTLDEAKRHGTVVGMLLVSRDAAPLQSVSQFYWPAFMMRVRADAPVESTAQITQEAHMWTRQDLVNHHAVPDTLGVDSPLEDWRAWTLTVDPLELRKTVPFTYSDYADHYRKSTYDKDGYVPGTEGERYGDTLYVAGEKAVIYASTSQAKPDGKEGKDLYDLDMEQRTVDWRIPFRVANPVNQKATTTATITVNLPKGITYLENSAVVDGTYTEHTPAQGTVDGGIRLHPTNVRHWPDNDPQNPGAVSYTFVIEGVTADNTTHHLRLSATIGDPFNPDMDAKNNQQYTLKTRIDTTHDRQPGTIQNGKYSEYTIKVSRTRASQLATRADPLMEDINQPLGFTNMVSNSAREERRNIITFGQPPIDGTRGSAFNGATRITGFTVSGRGVDTTNGNVALRVSTNPKYRDMAPDAFTAAMADSTDFTTLEQRADGTYAIPASVDATQISAFTVLIGTLPAGSRLDITYRFDTGGNQPSDLYVNQWSDGDNTVNALSTIVAREVNGVLWEDSNEDGARDPDEPLIGGVSVQLMQGLMPITLLDGKQAKTTTDEHGAYSFIGVPAGTGYHVRFTPTPATGWAHMAATIKHAPNVGANVNSDADPITTVGMLTGMDITLNPFPAVQNMTSSRYVDAHEDAGLIRTAIPKHTMPTTGQGLILIILLGISLTTMIGGIIILIRNNHR